MKVYRTETLVDEAYGEIVSLLRSGGVIAFPISLRTKLSYANRIRRRRLAVCVNTLQARAQALLDPPRASVIEEKVRMRLWKQRDHLFTFLEHPDVPATNNLAERQLRPAVIARKISCGNKTPKGAAAWAVLASVAATCRQTGRSLIESISRRVLLQPARGP